MQSSFCSIMLTNIRNKYCKFNWIECIFEPPPPQQNLHVSKTPLFATQFLVNPPPLNPSGPPQVINTDWSLSTYQLWSRIEKQSRLHSKRSREVWYRIRHLALLRLESELPSHSCCTCLSGQATGNPAPDGGEWSYLNRSVLCESIWRPR